MSQHSLLVTRPRASADRFIAQLREDIRQGTTIICAPLIDIVPTGVQVNISPYRGVIFTSSNAVELAPNGSGTAAFCVGEATAGSAQHAGWSVAFSQKTALELINRFRKEMPKGPLLHLAGRHRRGDIAGQLTAIGIKTDVEVLYDQTPVGLPKEALALLKSQGRVVVPLFSPRTAAQFMEQAPDLQNVIIIAMSDAVAQVCRGSNVAKVVVADTPTGHDMLRAVEKALRRTS